MAAPLGLFVNGSVPFLGIVAASKDWLLESGPGDRVKLYGINLQLGLDPNDEEHSTDMRWSYPRLGKKYILAGSVEGQVLKNLNNVKDIQ
jgi:hypothetical protein